MALQLPFVPPFDACFFALKTWARIGATLFLCFYFFTILQWIHYCYDLETIDDYGDFYDQVLSASINMVQVILCAVLIYAIDYDMPSMMAPFLVMEMLMLACRVRLDLRDLLHQTQEDYEKNLIVGLECTAAYSCIAFFWTVIYNHYRDLMQYILEEEVEETKSEVTFQV